MLEGLENLASKDPRELPDRQEESGFRADPALAVPAEASPGGDAVDVRVVLEELVPRVEHRDDARGRSEVAPADIDQRCRCGVEEEAMSEPRVSQEERVQAVREREDVVEVGHGEQVVQPRLDPQRLIQALALRTVAVAAGVVERSLVTAVVTASQMTAERSRAARDQRRDHARLVVTESG